MQKNKIFPVIIIACFIFLTTAATVSAAVGDPLATNPPVSGPCSSGAASNSIGDCIVSIYRWALGLAILLALVVIIFAGYMYMTAGGNANQVSTAKDMITNALIGLVILIGAVLILRTINPELTNFNSISPKTRSASPKTGKEYRDPLACSPACAPNQLCEIDWDKNTQQCVSNPGWTGACDPLNANSCPSGQSCVVNITTGNATCK